MKTSVKALKSKYALFIISIIGIVALQVILEYWFDHETMFSLLLSAVMLAVLILQFVYVFLPSLQRLSAVNRKLIKLRKSLEQRERQYRELVEGATDLIYELNSNGDFVYVNEIMLHMSGYTLEDVVGRSYLDLIHPDDRAYAAKFYRDQMKAGKEISYFEFRMIGKQGQTVWIGQNVRYFYEGNWVSSVRVVARDITQGRQAQLALEKLKEEAEHTTLAKSQFLSMMSHEIRTPMNAIIGLTHLLSDSTLTEEQRANVQLLKFSGENLLTIINDILDFSKIEAQKIILEAIDLDIRKLIDQTVQIHHANATEKGVKLMCHVDEKIPQFLRADPVRIIQVINNLLANAIKFTHEGGVRLELIYIAHDPVQVTCQLRVSDTGIGIAADKLDTIFESFSQAEDATTRKYGGTGLGLAITKKLVALMGGTIIVNSSPGAGATFICSLTIAIGTKPLVIDEPDAKTIALLEGAHVLLAEDNTMNQLIVISFLRKWNIESTIAVNGREALNLITRKSFDLVLMDLQMPEMSGYEVTEHIRAMQDVYYRNIPIIALTASAMTDVKARVLAAGMNDFLSKPFQPNELKRLLAKYIPAKVTRKPITSPTEPEDEKELYQSLLQSALDNLLELEDAFDQSFTENNPAPFRAAAHKCKMTLTFLNDQPLQDVVTKISDVLKESAPGQLTSTFQEKFTRAIRAAMQVIRKQLASNK